MSLLVFGVIGVGFQRVCQRVVIDLDCESVERSVGQMWSMNHLSKEMFLDSHVILWFSSGGPGLNSFAKSLCIV